MLALSAVSDCAIIAKVFAYPAPMAAVVDPIPVDVSPDQFVDKTLQAPFPEIGGFSRYLHPVVHSGACDSNPSGFGPT